MPGEPSMKKFPESGFPASKRRDPSAGRPMLPGLDAQDRKGRRHGDLKSKADAWEKAQMEKIRKRYVVPITFSGVKPECHRASCHNLHSIESKMINLSGIWFA